MRPDACEEAAPDGAERAARGLDVAWTLRALRSSPLEAELRRVPPGEGAAALVREATPRPLSLAARALARLGSDLRHVLPYEVTITGVATLRRGLSILRPEVGVLDPAGAPLGRLRQRLWASGGAFEALDARGRRVAVLRLSEEAATLEGAPGCALAEMRPARAPERKIRLDAALGPREAALLLAALAALDRVLEG